MNTRTTIILTVFFITSCVTNVNVDRWSPELQAKQNLAPPFIATFRYQEDQILFVAVAHATRKNTPTFKTIDKSFALLKPEIVIIEGLPNSLGLSPPWVAKRARECQPYNGDGGCSEALYAVLLADKTGVPFQGGEPSIRDEFNILVDYGNDRYGIEDFFGLQIVRGIIQLKRGTTNPSPDQFHRQVVSDITYLAKEFPEMVDYAEESFVEWYLSNLGGEYFGVKESSLAPKIGIDTNFLQNLSYHLMLGRDLKLNAVIKNALTTHDRILVVYGAAHLAALKRVLSKHAIQIEERKIY